ncbi:MAG: AMP-binding protein [Verrucomicrobia bacterium]|nr:AMP-binding protein [Verrucomicrobiota bacterium]
MATNSLSVHRLLAQNADLFAERPSVINESLNSLTHAGLLKHIEATVLSLNSYGIGRNDRVAIVLPQGPELAVAFLSVASGATAAPLNYHYKENDFKFYLEDLGARALIVLEGDETASRVAAAALEVPVIELRPHDKGDGSFDLLGVTRPLQAHGGFSEPEDIGLILHTSGTTSRPKMVPLTQANLCISASNIIETVQLKPEDRCLNVMPLFHIHGLVACILASLGAGGSTVCARSFDAKDFLGWLDVFKPSWYSAVPTMHQAVLGQALESVSSSLRFIRSSSAALPPPVMQGLEAIFSVPVIESYGMTEAAHQMTSNPLPPQSRKPGSVGLAAGPEVCVLGDDNNILSHGEIGEISIKGANVTSGYENNPAANESAFTEGWFRTGDQGYLDEEGYLFLTGRLKEMINRGGENIAPREIDEALLTHPEIKQAVGFAIPHDSLGEDVAAAVILEENSALDEVAIRAYAMERLSDFKVPNRIIILDDIPKGPTGKLQRIGLAEKLRGALEFSYVKPENEVENFICNQIEEILKINEVGRNNNFFSLGGDSLRATQVVTRLNEAYNLQMPVTVLFRFPNPVLLSIHLDTLIAEQEVESLAGEMGELSPDEIEALMDDFDKLSHDNVGQKN